MRLRGVNLVALLSALSFVMMTYLEFPLPLFPPYLKYDPSEVPALIGGFALGPRVGVWVVFLKNLLYLLLSGKGLQLGMIGIVGVLMNFSAGTAFTFTATLIYKIQHTKRGAVKGLILGIIAMAVVMIPLNTLMLPLVFGMPRAVAITTALLAITPFNLIKGVFSSILTFFLYKRVSGYLHRWY